MKEGLKLRIRVLTDNYVPYSTPFCGEHGASYFVEDNDGTKILMDMGKTDVFIKNAEKMGIDVTTANKIVFSHGHYDHTWGLQHFIDKIKDTKNMPEMVVHPLLFDEKNEDGRDIGINTTVDEVKKYFKLTMTRGPYKLSENITYLGEIKRRFDFENKKPLGETVHNGVKHDDFIYDDSAMVYKNSEGIYIITGCSHSGICNIIEQAKEVSGEENVIGIIGGFHLIPKNEQLYKTIEYLKSCNIKEFYPGHCTSYDARFEMSKSLDVRVLSVGLDISCN